MKANQDAIVKLTTQEQEVYEKLKNAFTLRFVSQLNDAMNTALQQVARNGSTALILTDLYFQLAAFLTPKQ